MDLSGKVSIITGANSGLGLATALLFARRGAMITLCGRDQGRLQTALEECTQASGGHSERFITVLGDVMNPGIREDIVRKTIEKFGCLDILVANAGVSSPISTLQDITEEFYDHIFDTNVKSVLFLIQKAAPHLEKSKGNIINVSSISSTAPYTQTVYPMSKAAVDHMTRCLALDLGPKGIRVNAVNPAFIASRIRRDYPGDLDKLVKENLEKEIPKLPMGQCGEPEDVAQTIAFLASDAAKFITGECILVDGGRTLTGARDDHWQSSASKK